MAVIAAQSYGEALFQLALEENNLDCYKEQLQMIVHQLNENPTFLQVMTHPKIHKDEKKQTLQQVFQENVNRMVLNFLKLLIDKGRFACIFAITKDFIKRYNQHNDIEVVVVHSARKLTKIQEKQVLTMLEKKLSKKIELRVYKDESLLAGMRIKIKDVVLDYSASSKLHALKQQARSITSPQES